MERIIIDYNNLNTKLLEKLINKFPFGYDDNDVINSFNEKGELIKAIEITSENTTYLIKAGYKLNAIMEEFSNEVFHIGFDFS